MIADFPTLCRMSGYTTAGRVRAWLARRGIKYLVGKEGKPSTTVEALNRALYPVRQLGDEPDFSPPCDYRPRSTKRMDGITTSTKTGGSVSPDAMKENLRSILLYTNSRRTSPPRSIKS